MTDPTHYWKFGVHFGGAEYPDHYPFIFQEKIVIGRWECTPFCIDDFLAVTDGFKVLAVVRIAEHPRRITEKSEYRFIERQYNIAFEPNTIFAKGDWCVLQAPYYRLPIEMGCCAVLNPDHRANLFRLWSSYFDPGVEDARDGVNRK